MKKKKEKRSPEARGRSRPSSRSSSDAGDHVYDAANSQAAIVGSEPRPRIIKIHQHEDGRYSYRVHRGEPMPAKPMMSGGLGGRQNIPVQQQTGGYSRRDEVFGNGKGKYAPRDYLREKRPARPVRRVSSAADNIRDNRRDRNGHSWREECGKAGVDAHRGRRRENGRYRRDEEVEEPYIRSDSQKHRDHRVPYPHKPWDRATEEELRKSFHEPTRRPSNRDYDGQDRTEEDRRRARSYSPGRRGKLRKEKRAQSEEPKRSSRLWAFLPLILGAIHGAAEPKGGWEQFASKSKKVERSFKSKFERRRRGRPRSPPSPSSGPRMSSRAASPPPPPKRDSRTQPRGPMLVPDRYQPKGESGSSRAQARATPYYSDPSRPPRAGASYDDNWDSRHASLPPQPSRRNSSRTLRPPKTDSTERIWASSPPQDQMYGRFAGRRQPRRMSLNARPHRPRRHEASVAESERRRFSRRSASQSQSDSHGLDGVIDHREINNKGKGVRFESLAKEPSKDVMAGAEGLGILLLDSKTDETGSAHRYEPPNVVSVADTSESKIPTSPMRSGLAGADSLAATETAID